MGTPLPTPPRPSAHFLPTPPPTPSEEHNHTPQASPTIQCTTKPKATRTRIQKPLQPNRVITLSSIITETPIYRTDKVRTPSTDHGRTDWVLNDIDATAIAVISLCHCKEDDKGAGHRHCVYCNTITSSRIEKYSKHVNTHRQQDLKDGVHCTYCGQQKSRSSLRRHLLEIHGINELPRLLFSPINNTNTVFAVRTTTRGNAYITHVDNETRTCSGPSCMRATVDCEHLTAVKDELPRRRPLELEPFLPLDYIEKAHFLSDREIQFLKQFMVECQSAGVHALVALEDVLVDEIVTYSLAALGVDGKHTSQRVCITYYPATVCTQQKWSLSEGGIVHKSRYIIIAAMYRHRKYGGSMSSYVKQHKVRTGSFLCIDVPTTTYQKIPEAQAMTALRRYTEHIVATTTIPFSEAEGWLHKQPIIVKLKPTETICFICSGPLISSVHTVKLLTLQGEQSILSEKRRCAPCEFKYRHTDISSGILMYGQHAYHVSLMVMLDNMMKRQGNFTLFWKGLQDTWGLSVGSDTAMKAYYFYTELVKLSDAICCPHCGPEPDIVFLDVCGKLKTEFDHQILENEIKGCGETTPTMFSLGDWENRVALARVHSAFNGGVNAGALAINHTLFAPPYVLECVRRTLPADRAFNTDWVKRKGDIVQRLLKESEGTIDPMGVELYSTIDNLITQKLVVINAFAKAIECSLPAGTAKPSAITAIQRHIMKAKGIHETEFNKFFPSWKKTTGGIMALLCSHGIIYYFKSLIGGEGPSDAADAMLTVRAKIYVYDAIGSAVSHMRRRSPEFFGTARGLPVDNTRENIDAVKSAVSNGVNLAKPIPTMVDLSELRAYPYRIALCDPLHIQNSSSEVDRYLRRIDLISGLETRLNTMPQEHVWKRTLQLKHSMNSMSYGNFWATFRRNTQFHNADRYNQLIRELTKPTKIAVGRKKRTS